MKRYGDLWNEVVSWDNLVLAAHKSRKGKRSKGCVQRFEFNLESELLRLQADLVNGDYVPGEFQTHWISRPKRRMISAASYRDRVVHHALMNLLEPILERDFHPASFACRKGKGTHAATDRLQGLMKHNRYALQCDIQKFFPSIDHQILKDLFRRLIKDRKVLRLMDMIVDYSNEQETANAWFRGDDFVVLAKDRDVLIDLRYRIKEHLENIRLSIHRNKNFIRPTKAGLSFVGMRIWPYHRLLRKNNIKSFKKRIKWMQKAYACGLIDTDYIQPRLASWIGHSSNTNNYKLLCRLCKSWKFQRARPDELSRYSRRQLEQQRQQLYCLEQEQQQPEQREQQHRFSGVSLSASLHASSRISRNCDVYGYYKCGGENPRRCPELMGRKFCSRISMRLSVIGRANLEDSTQPLNAKSRLAA